MKAYRVYNYAETSYKQREAAWQAFYDAAGILGIDVTGWREEVQRIFAREALKAASSSITIVVPPPRMDSFDTYDSAASYSGEGLR